jgi:symplekin
MSLRKMAERLGRYALIFRDEPDPSDITLRGMSYCEQIVYLHHLDFQKVGIPQKRYLDSIRICLEDDEVFNDRVVQAALDHMSGKNLEGESLPLAYMRTIILTCSKHESLHSWICHVLLPRLVEGKVYSDKRQWEGWMRCAKMLENTRDAGISSLEAIKKLPEEMRQIYRTKYPQK